MSDSNNASRETATGASNRRRDAVFGIGTAIAALIFALFVIPAGIVSPSSVKHLAVSPTFLPYVLTALIGVLGVICAVQALVMPPRPETLEDQAFVLRADWPAYLALIIGAGAAYYLLPEEIGMLTVAIAVTGTLIWLERERRPLILIGVAVLLPVILYLFFTRVAQVPLPPGVFDGLI